MSATAEPAPEIVMDANGNYWRRYPDFLSMCPVSDDNDPIAYPVTVYAIVGVDREPGGDPGG